MNALNALYPFALVAMLASAIWTAIPETENPGALEVTIAALEEAGE